MPGKIYIREEEVVEVSSIPLKTLRQDRYLKKGIPYIKKNRSVYYNINDILEFMESNKVKTERH